MIVPLDQPLALQLSGSDAGKVFHNMTTNHVLTVAVGDSMETFVTDVRGWVVAHGLIYRIEENRWWLLGQHPHPEKVASHIDRYIIREDAVVNDLSPQARLTIAEANSSDSGPPDQAYARTSDQAGDQSSSKQDEQSFSVPFPALEPSATLQVHIGTQAEPVRSDSSTVQWDRLRISRFWPKFSQDIWEKCIPQELDRNAQAISFTKGCYLGQETIARLDALGQIQKKLSLVQFAAPGARPQSAITSEGREIGHITSSVDLDDSSLCLALLKRGFFEPEVKLECGGVPGTVLPPPLYGA
jgi:tRNA-modifying protein YgfZ